MKRVLVTGSSRGIGAAIARRLSTQGWTVALHGATHLDEAEALGREIGALGVYQADLADPAAVDRLWEAAHDEGPIHALVNNAGVYRPLGFLEASDSAFEECRAATFAVNLEAPLRLMRRAAQVFAEQGGGRVLNVASRVGFRGEAGAALYSASKAALINLTRALAVELAPARIGVYGIAPGWVETAMAREGMETRLQQIVRDIPLGRMASVEDCAAAAAFLLSEDADYLSGVVIDINGASYFH
jgi:3-oxoacyl-[acyl-carrier protein] reductase